MPDDVPVPSGWEHGEHRTYTPAGHDTEMQYVTYLHESGDLRLRIAPASLDGEDEPGYTLQATIYPGLDFSESTTIRHVLTFSRCHMLTNRFMQLFSGVYDGPGNIEEALAYAEARTRASSAYDSPVRQPEE